MGESYSFQHLILDWNGTLIDDLDAAVQGVNSGFESANLSPIDHEAYRHHFRFPIRDFYESLGFDLDRMPFSDVIRVYLSAFNENILNCQLHSGVYLLLRHAKNLGMTISILSASQHKTLLDNLKYYQLLGWIDHVFGLDGSEAEGKFDIARRLDDRLSHPGMGALMIGDTDHDVEVALSRGWTAASVGNGHQSVARLRATSTEVFPSLVTLMDHFLPPLSAPHAPSLPSRRIA